MKEKKKGLAYALMKQRYGKNIDKKGNFTRPEGWEKDLKSSHFDSSKTVSGEKKSDIVRKAKEKSGSAKQKTTLNKIREFFSK